MPKGLVSMVLGNYTKYSCRIKTFSIEKIEPEIQKAHSLKFLIKRGLLLIFFFKAFLQNKNHKLQWDSNSDHQKGRRALYPFDDH